MKRAEETTPTTVRKRRGVVRASITRLASRLDDLERKTDQISTRDAAQRMSQKVNELDSEFKTYHYGLIDLIDDDETLRKEQMVLDEHDDTISLLTTRIEHLISACTPKEESAAHKAASRKLLHLDKSLSSISDAISSLTDKSEPCLIQQYGEQVHDIKSTLGDTRNTLLSMDLDVTDTLMTTLEHLDKGVFDCSLKIKRLMYSSTPLTDSTTSSTPSAEGSGVKLPKLAVPKFDGELVNWRTFWEQFCISIHDKSSLSDSEKLAYLRHSLKDGSARSVIEGLSRSGDCYKEAIDSLKTRYDRPRLIHQTHVKKIIEAAALKDGGGRELRRLHDTVQQHIRALKAMGHDPPGPFVTSLIELKLDATTMFEWQRYTQDSTDVPHFQKLLDFINLRAQACEASTTEPKKSPRNEERSTKRVAVNNKSIAVFTASASDTTVSSCVVCKTENHPLYACTKFKSFSHEKKVSTLKSHNHCMNCLRPGHFVRECKSLHKCKKCQMPHHTLLHIEPKSDTTSSHSSNSASEPVSSNAATGPISNSLLMTCRVIVHAPDGSSAETRGLLDCGSSASFVSERLSQSLSLTRSRQSTKIHGIAGLSHHSQIQAIANFDISPTQDTRRKLSVTAVIVPKVTCDLPLHPVQCSTKWKHISGIHLADPHFCHPGRIDLLLGVDIFTEVLRQGRRTGPPGSPIAIETEFGWVIAGKIDVLAPTQAIASHHATITADEVLQKFWEVEENPKDHLNFSTEERMVVQHFSENHYRTKEGRFVVPLPKKPQAKPLGESRSQAVRRFLTLERSLRSKGNFEEFDAVISEYFHMGHAEKVPVVDLHKPVEQVFYLPIHAVRKESNTTTKVRAVFDASAKSSTGVSLNDLLLVGPTIHPSLIDVLLRFRFHRIALTADISKMYRAIKLIQSDKDLHRFVWRQSPEEPLQDFRMTRVTFGVSASSYAANMSVKQNAIELASEYPLAVEVVDKAFYVDDCLSGADTPEEAIEMHKQLLELFNRGGFLLRKWNSSDLTVLQQIPPELRDSQSLHIIQSSDEYTKTLGIQWNPSSDHFRLTIADLPPLQNLTKRTLVSDIAKTFDVLGWFSPTIIKMKILLQQLWELRIDWDDLVPEQIRDSWMQWRTELDLLSTKHIPRCYYSKTSHISAIQLHGFCDASESAYAAVVYLRLTDSDGDAQVTLVTSKTKVAPIKKLTIPRLELCGAYLLADLLYHVKQVFDLSLNQVYAWTDSTIVLNWLVGDPRRFKTFVNNRVSHIVEIIGPKRWNHVSGRENPADCASRGLFPSELLQHSLWWNGPEWLKLKSSMWPSRLDVSQAEEQCEEEISLHTVTVEKVPIISIDQYSSYTCLKRITAWVFRFIENCRNKEHKNLPPSLTTEEIRTAENYWLSLVQGEQFAKELELLKENHDLPKTSSLLHLHPFLDSANLLRVGGREHNSNRSYSNQHPVILPGKHPVTKLIVRSEHLRLLHAGATLLMCSLSRRFYIIRCRQVVRQITRGCTTCRRLSTKPQAQLLGQLPIERITPDLIFDKVGVDYAGPVYIKYGHVRKPVVVKAYICVFVSLSIKAVHLELTSDLTTDAFIASLRRFISRRGKPSLIWSDNGSNFVGASREITELMDFLKTQTTQSVISDFCTIQNIEWRFIPEHAPHFGGLWEAAVKSMKKHLKRVVANVKLTFEEFSTVLTQIEACLNSRPLVPLPHDDDGVEALTPGHFLIGRPLEALPDPAFSHRNVSLLKRWYLSQALLRQFWQRWSAEYLTSLKRYNKWHYPTRNICVGDVVVLQEDKLVPTKWPIARVIETHPGKDGLVRVATVKTATGTYKRPTTKLALLVPLQE